MFLEVEKAKYLSDYQVFLEFNDGSSGTVDFKDLLYGGMFEPLKDRQLFSQVYCDHEIGTICWPNGADLAPTYLKEHLH
jgi:hypothetical protein